MSSLLHYAAGNASGSATERLRLVAVIIAAFMDHDSPACNVFQLETRRNDFLCCRPIALDYQYRKIATMSFAAWPSMLSLASGIIMAACGNTCCLLAILHTGLAAGFFVNMKTMGSGWQLAEIRG